MMKEITDLLYRLGIVVLTIIVVGCGIPSVEVAEKEIPMAVPTPSTLPTELATAVPELIQVDENGCTLNNLIEIRWFVGLGTGTEPEQRQVSDKLADSFNQRNEACIVLLVEYVDNNSAPAVLSARIASGNTPDIIGPVGLTGRALFGEELLDLEKLEGFDSFDKSDYDPELVDLFDIADKGQIGIPFAVYPSFLYVNLDLFDEAGLPYPPTNYSGKYTLGDKERDWDVDTLRDVAMLLTMDTNGNNAVNPDFNPDEPQTFGYANQWTGDIRGRFSIFGGAKFWEGSLNAPKAIIPERWRDAADWYYRAMWIDHFHPKRSQDALFDYEGYWFDSGKLAMVQTHLWYVDSFDQGNFEWNIFAAPAAPDGNTTAKIHADTFSILEKTEHPNEAFMVLQYLLGHLDIDKDGEEDISVVDTLLDVYNGMPARRSLQDAYFVKSPLYDKNYQVASESMLYRDIPSHEASMPKIQEAQLIMQTFEEKLDNPSDLETFDVNAELEVMQEELQALFDAP